MAQPNTLNNKNLQTAAKSLIPCTFLQKSGSIAIQSSTTGTTTAPDLYSYAPSAGQTVYLTFLNLMVYDNTQWDDLANIGDYSSFLTDGFDIKVDYGGAVSYSIIDAANSSYFARNQELYGRFCRRSQLDTLYGIFTNDDRAIIGYFDFSGQNIILKGDNSDKIYIAVRQDLTIPAIEVIWATVGGWLL